MKIAVTGASGLIGTALVESLVEDGHEVVRLVRRAARSSDEVRWDPPGGTVDTAGLHGVEGVVHLAGAGVGDRRWTESWKREVLRSRVQGTRTIATAVAALDPAPSVLVSMSAVGYYGDRGDEELTEESGPGSGFLAEVVREWEASAAPAVAAGIRVVHPRTGLVLSPEGGALGRLLPVLKLGAAGPLGSGRQYWPWITLADQVAALRFLLERDLDGPVNVCGPQPARNAEVTRALGRAYSRPTLVPVPAVALRAVLGGFADEGVLVSQRVLPRRLLDAGFVFAHPDLETAARWVAGR